MHTMDIEEEMIMPEEKENIEEIDVVNHPSHYTDGGIETIDFIDAKGLSYCLGNAVKYISRAGKKDPSKTIEDLRKAAWYVEHEIKRLQGQESDEKPSEGVSNMMENKLHEPKVDILFDEEVKLKAVKVTCAVCNETIADYCCAGQDEVIYGNYCQHCGARLKEVKHEYD